MITENYKGYKILDSQKEKKRLQKLTISKKIKSIHLQSNSNDDCCIFIDLCNGNSIVINALSGNFNAYLELEVKSTNQINEESKPIMDKLINQIFNEK